MAFGSMRWPRRKSLRVVMGTSVAVFLDRVRLAAAFARLAHDGDRLLGAVGDREQREIGRSDLTLSRHALAQPIGQARPVRHAEQDHRKMLHLPGLDEREGLRSE